MQIETYVLQSSSAEVEEAEIQERKALLEELALTTENQIKEPIPFPQLNATELRAWGVLLPRSNQVKDYQGYIPTPVLRLYKAYKDLFERVEIWHRDEDPDPILVGKLKNGSAFLLARWGDKLLVFGDILTTAMKMYCERRESLLRSMLASVEADTILYFQGQHVDNWIR